MLPPDWPWGAMCLRLLLESIARPEDPPDHGKADEEEGEGRRERRSERHVRGTEEGPAEAVDQIDDRVEQGDRAPRRREHVDRVESAAEEGEGSHNQQRDHLQLLETLRPD